jgi:hypothetical protein
VGHFDTDLSEWAGKYRGYGVSRGYAMLRAVGGGDWKGSETRGS